MATKKSSAKLRPELPPLPAAEYNPWFQRGYESFVEALDCPGFATAQQQRAWEDGLNRAVEEEESDDYVADDEIIKPAPEPIATQQSRAELALQVKSLEWELEEARARITFLERQRNYLFGYTEVSIFQVSGKHLTGWIWVACEETRYVYGAVQPDLNACILNARDSGYPIPPDSKPCNVSIRKDAEGDAWTWTGRSGSASLADFHDCINAAFDHSLPMRNTNSVITGIPKHASVKDGKA